MNVASLDLCKELYELAGWEDTAWSWYCDEEWDDTPVMNLSEPLKVTGGVGYFDHQYPAYDLGFLLRKLPSFVASKEYPDQPAYLDIGLRNAGPPWFAWYACLGIQDVMSDFGVHADTPEDAACKLAIELLKQGVLTK